MKDEQDMQEKLMKMQMLEQQMTSIQKQLQQLEGQLMDLDATKESLDGLKNSEKGSEMLSMVSPGIFVKTGLTDNKEVVINVGAGVAVKKNIEDAKKLVDEQIEEVKNVHIQLMEDMQKLNSIMLRIDREEQDV